jgi:hypothetical protein
LKPSVEQPDEQLEYGKEVIEDMPDYLNEAANVISKAIECESEERFDESVACYRKAIGTLLTSLPKDKSLKRQASVKRRIAQYISKAESLAKLAEQQPADGQLKTKLKGFPHLDLFGDVKDLKRYHVERILGGKVILATDSKQDGNPKVVIKTLQKTSITSRAFKTSMLPMNIRYMAKLKGYYETDETLILVMDYISPGQLFNIVHPYLVSVCNLTLNKTEICLFSPYPRVILLFQV